MAASNWQLAVRHGFGRQPALSNQPGLGSCRKRIATPSTGLGFHYELGRVMSDVVYTYSSGRTRIRPTDYNAAALGMNAVQVSLAGDGFADLVFVQNVAEANAVVPLYRRLSLRLLYRFETCRIRDWHYDGISVNPMPANNGAYLDFGPQDYKVHLFGALFRYEL